MGDKLAHPLEEREHNVHPVDVSRVRGAVTHRAEASGKGGVI